jgi:hypothetical protein
VNSSEKKKRKNCFTFRPNKLKQTQQELLKKRRISEQKGNKQKDFTLFCEKKNEFLVNIFEVAKENKKQTCNPLGFQ